MRGRTLLSGGSIEYVFSAQTYVSVSDSSGSRSVNIQSTANGSNIGYSVVSYDGTVVTRVTTAATYVTIRYSTNSTYYSRSGNVVLKQNGSNKTITINVSQSAIPLSIIYDGILLDGTSGSYGSISKYIDGNVSFSSVPPWANVTYSSGKINVTATETNSDIEARLDTITVHVGSSNTTLSIIQLPSDYHSRSYVSIGGKNWSIKNVGASSVQDYGNFYGYGKGSETYVADDDIYQGTEDPLASTADTATQVMGSGWRMPTSSECQSLTGYSYYYWVSYNGVNGGVFKSYTSGNVLFFPAAGYNNNGSIKERGEYSYIWSSTPKDSSRAYSMYAFGLYTSSSYVTYRYNGLSVRGVQS